MCCSIFPKVASFVLTFAISVLIVSGLEYLFPGAPPDPLATASFGSGSAIGDSGTPLKASESRAATAPVRILYQPKAVYTEAAREREIEGGVRLKIVLRADGTVGTITPLSELPYGLTERAIAAARQIRFEPKQINGKNVDVVVIREYVFTIY